MFWTVFGGFINAFFVFLLAVNLCRSDLVVVRYCSFSFILRKILITPGDATNCFYWSNFDFLKYYSVFTCFVSIAFNSAMFCFIVKLSNAKCLPFLRTIGRASVHIVLEIIVGFFFVLELKFGCGKEFIYYFFLYWSPFINISQKVLGKVSAKKVLV